MGEKKKSVADIDPALLKRLEKSLSELKEDIVEGSNMIFPNVPLDSWIKKFDLEELCYSCPKCQKEFKLSIPLLINGYAGIMSPIHECGDNCTDMLLTPNKPESEKLWINFMGYEKKVPDGYQAPTGKLLLIK